MNEMGQQKPVTRSGNNSRRFCFVGSDIYIECSMAARRMGEHTGGRGKVAIIGVIDDNNTEAGVKTRIFISQLTNHYPGIEIVKIAGCGKYEVRDSAAEITRQILREHPDIAGVYSNADEAIAGIVLALGEVHLCGRVCLVGYGNEPHIMKYVAEGAMTCALLHSRFVYGFDTMVHLFNKVVAGVSPPRQRMLINPDIVTLETLDEYWRPDEGFLIPEEARRYLAKPLPLRPAKPLRFALHLEGVGNWFSEIIRGALEAQKMLPDTTIEVNNWRIDDTSSEQVNRRRVDELRAAKESGFDGVVLWVLNEDILPHVAEVVAGGMEVAVFHTEPVNYDAITPEVDEVFASLFRQIILKEHAEQRLRVMSIKDELTGLNNRRRFNALIDQEVRALSRTPDSCLSLLMIDVDHFKRFNDVHGHLGGDACLAEVGRIINRVVRRGGDNAARYGGEEFAVILPHAILEGALGLAETLRLAIQECAPPDVRGFESVTVSIGVAAMSGAEADRSVEELIRRADEALYRAKANGRNRVERAHLP